MPAKSDLKRAIQNRYAALAENAADSCCGTGQGGAEDCCGSGLYTAEQLQRVPSEAASASAGCGNPTAFGELKSGETVVDFGSGGGIDAFLAAKAVGPRGRVIGIDFTPAMVQLARTNAAKVGAGNVEFRLGEIERVPLPDSSADVIISNCVINLSKSKDAVFREAFRILSPGGRIYVSDIVLAQRLPKAIAGAVEFWSACVSGAVLKDEYLGLVNAAGFGDVTIVAESPSTGIVHQEWADSLRSLSFRARKPR